jgi:cob(I)alamin adenosyltransferase
MGESRTVPLWTGKGDDGTTGLLFGGRVPKDDAAPTAYGSVDEAQAAIGLARAEARERGDHELDTILTAVERDLWVLMAELATAADNRHKLTDGATRTTAEMVDRLEHLTTEAAQRFEPPREFVLPGQNRQAALLDVARTVVRRAERDAVSAANAGPSIQYLNRLSSLLWALARVAEAGDTLKAKEAPDFTEQDDQKGSI